MTGPLQLSSRERQTLCALCETFMGDGIAPSIQEGVEKELSTRRPYRRLLRLAYRWAWGRSRVAASLGPRPHRALRLASFGKGMLAGARAPVDRASALYLSSNGALDPGTARLGSHTHD